MLSSVENYVQNLEYGGFEMKQSVNKRLYVGTSTEPSSMNTSMSDMLSHRMIEEDLMRVSQASTESAKEDAAMQKINQVSQQLASQKKFSKVFKAKSEDIANKVKENVISKGPNFVRRIVSKGRRRFVQNGFDLDLAYVTDRIISTSFPASGTEALFRNSMNDFASFMRTYHAEKFKVYNLCSESRYDPSKLDSRVVRYPCDDMQPPSLEVLDSVVTNIHDFLNSDPDHIIAVHCKAGKGRTGVVVCSALLKTGTCSTVQDALDLFAHRRTKNGKGVTIPSQQRYIHYYNQILTSTNTTTQQDASWGGSNIVSLKLTNIIKLIQKNVNTVYNLELFNRNIWTMLQTRGILSIQLPSVEELKSTGGQIVRDGFSFSRDGYDLTVEFENDDGLELYGDVKMQLFKQVGKGQKSLFYMWFNVGLEAENPVLEFETKNLDKCSTETKKYHLGVEVQLCPSLPISVAEPSERDENSIVEAIQQLKRESDNMLDSLAMSRTSSQPNMRSMYNMRRQSRGHDSAVSLQGMRIKSSQFTKQNSKLSSNNLSNISQVIKDVESDNASMEQTDTDVATDIMNILEDKWFRGL